MIPLDAVDAVACWLLTYAVHSTVLIGLAVLLTRLGTFREARAQDLLWKGALVGGLLTASVQVGVGGTPARHLIADAGSPATLAVRVFPDGPGERPMVDGGSASAPALATRPVASPPDAPVPSSIPSPWPAGVVLVWAAGAAIGSVRRLAQRRRFFRGLGPRRPVNDPDLVRTALAVGAACRLRHPVRLTTVDGLAVPIALGTREICVPGRVTEVLDPPALRALLAHEAAHLTRRDPLWLLACTVLEGALFFQPLNRYARRRFQDNAEILCDAVAVERTGRREDLARCLVEVASWLLSPPRVAVAGMAASGSRLEARVEHVLRGEGVRPLRSYQVLAGLALLLAVGGAAPGFAPASGSPEPPLFEAHLGVPPGLPVRTYGPVRPQAVDERAEPASAGVGMSTVAPAEGAATEDAGEEALSDGATDGLGASPLRRGDEPLVVDGPVVSLGGRPVFDLPLGTSVRSGSESTVVRIYDADHGLFLFGAVPFEGSAPSGRFEGDAVVFSWAGREVHVRSRAARPILRGGDRTAHVRIVPAAEVPSQERALGARWIGVVDPAAWQHALELRQTRVWDEASGVRPALPQMEPAAPAARQHALELRQPRVWVDGRLVRSYDAYVGADGYLLVREPEIGILVVGTHPISRRDPAGEFDGTTLRLTHGGHDVRVESTAPIMAGGPRAAYVHLIDKRGGEPYVGGGDAEGALRQLGQMR